RRYCLLNGLDDIGLTLRHLPEIEAFEKARRQSAPWAFLD
ncbi:MAG: 3-isopropylmalate dehydratase small subunit, partial [Gammaproteobacteria bacterium]|nr:3-isopropylmalate dehydratase small subunit [Gammaproteobacteria bacterium]